MVSRKKKPGSSIQPKTPLSTLVQPSSNISVFFPLSSSSYQKDCELMDVWLHTQSLPEKLLQCWKNIRNHSLSEFQPPSTQPSHLDITSKIFKELENINKRLDKQEAKLSYAQAAQKAISSQIPLAPRTLREVLVHPGNQTSDMANRTHVQLFQALQDRLPSPFNKQVRVVRKLPSGDILISTESQEAKSFLEKDSTWITTIFTKEAIVQPKRFPILVHGVRTSDIQPEDLSKTCQAIQSSNPSLSKQITILRAYWSKKAISQKKLVTSLHLDLATPKQANLLIENGLVLGHRLHEVEPFLADTVIAQYFKYFGYGYQARVCKNKAVCGAYGGQHEKRACSIPEQLLKPRCCNCQ